MAKMFYLESVDRGSLLSKLIGYCGQTACR